MKTFLKKIKPKIFSKGYSIMKEGIFGPSIATIYHISLNFSEPYHNKPFGFFQFSKNKTIDPSKLKTLIQDYNDSNQKEGINFDEIVFLENAKEVFEYTRPLLLKKDTEVLNIDLLTYNFLDNLTRFYKNFTTELINYELCLMNTKIDSFSSFKTNDDLFTYVRVEVVLISNF
jgi:hypothetical protein